MEDASVGKIVRAAVPLAEMFGYATDLRGFTQGRLAAAKPPVLHGDRDSEVPTPQGYEFWHALKTLGVPTELVIYPNEGHGIRKPEQACATSSSSMTTASCPPRLVQSMRCTIASKSISTGTSKASRKAR